jgi:hypothetical protein
MLHKSPPAEVPQQLFESSHCPDALPLDKAARSLRARPRATTSEARRQDNIASCGALFTAYGGSAPWLTTGWGVGVKLTTPPNPI